MYRIVLCIFAVFANEITALTQEQQAELQSVFVHYGLACSKEYPIEDEALEGLKNNQFPDGLNAGCFAACIFKKAGIFDSLGKLTPNAAIDSLRFIVRDTAQLELLSKVLEACTHINQLFPEDDTGCKRASAAYNCLLENSKKMNSECNGYNEYKEIRTGILNSVHNMVDFLMDPLSHISSKLESTEQVTTKTTNEATTTDEAKTTDKAMYELAQVFKKKENEKTSTTPRQETKNCRCQGKLRIRKP